jgi:hypothetical protein
MASSTTVAANYHDRFFDEWNNRRNVDPIYILIFVGIVIASCNRLLLLRVSSFTSSIKLSE